MELLNNNTSAIIILLLCTTLFTLSAYLNSKSKHNYSLLLLVVGGLFLRILISSDVYLHDHDEKFHALVAKNVIEHPFEPTLYETPIHDVNYKDWSSNHIWLHKQPVPLWSIALSLKIFGTTEFAVRIPSILLSTLSIWLLFQISLFFFNQQHKYKIAWISAFLFSINGLILELTGGRIATDHYDIFFMFFILLAIYFTIKFILSNKKLYTILTGISIGLAILTKWLPALIVIPIWFLLTIESKKFTRREIIINLIMIISFAVITFLPWQLYISKNFPLEASYVASHNQRHVFEVLDKQTGPLYYYLIKWGTNYGELVYLPILFMFITAFKQPKNLKLWSLVIWITIPIIFFSIAMTKMQGYILFTSPALFIIIGWFYVNRRNLKLSGIKKYLNYTIIALIIILPLRYSIERIKPLNSNERNPEWSIELKKFSKNKFPKKTILFNYQRPIRAMFYANITAYSEIPSLQDIKEYIEAGYTVLINKSNNLPVEITKLEEITFVELQ